MKSVYPLLFLATTNISLSANLNEVKEAIEQRFPHIAVEKIKEIHPEIAEGTAPREVILLYARALIEDGQASRAIALLQENASDINERFLLAQAFAGIGDWARALTHYTACAEDSSFDHSGEALIGKIRMLRNSGHPAEALEAWKKVNSLEMQPVKNAALLEATEAALDLEDTESALSLLELITPLQASETTRLKFLRGKIALLSGDYQEALRQLHSLKPSGWSMAVQTTAIKAKAMIETSQIEQAEILLEEFISSHPNVDGLHKLFALLDECYAASTAASSNELKRWSQDSADSPAKKLATYYLARFETRGSSPEASLPMLEELAKNPENNPMADETELELAALRIRLGRPEEALGGLPGLGLNPHTDYLRGLALARIGDQVGARAAFLEATRDPNLSPEALFNAAICELLALGDFDTAFDRLQNEYPGKTSIEVARMQRAFHLAREGSPEAEAALESLSSSPDAAMAAKARLALAEWKYQQLNSSGAKEDLVRVSTSANPARQAALQVFLMDNGELGSEEKTVEAARGFLSAYPENEAAPSVWMKLGEILFRKGDYASARVELESLARKFPGSDYEESALFLAAQSAARIPLDTAAEEAILLFEEVASDNGVLAASARMEQASILAAQGKPLEANIILDKILAGAPDHETRSGALMEKGKNLFRLGEKDPENYRLSIGVWKQVAAEEEDPAWVNQAMTRVGGAYEKLGDPGAAIAAYYEVFKTSEGPLLEFFWFYKSGFAAGRILEDEEKWDEALRVYELMAAVEGPRALEARERINKLRLEHFLWEED